MELALVIGGVAVALTVVLISTGWWRSALILFRIPAHSMTVERLGLRVTVPEDIHRVDTILQNFVGGFNRMITAASYRKCQDDCDALPSEHRPFAHEGVAMGYMLHFLRFDPAAFERRLVRRRPGYRYLYYVGLGFWAGMRRQHPRRLIRMVGGLDPLHRYLCFDGYGFRYAFLDYLKRPDSIRALDRFDGYAVHAAYQGVGRAFYFLFMNDADLLVEHIDGLGRFAHNAAAGAGLAAAFVHTDRLEVARTLARKLPESWQPHFQLGMCFGLKARAIADPEQFAKNSELWDGPEREAVHRSIEACDEIEARVRAGGGDDGYRRWREQVTLWMTERIQYPLASVRKSIRPVHSSAMAAHA